MAFVNTVRQSFLGGTVPTTFLQRTNVATNTGTTSVALPASGTFSPTITFAVVRAKTLTIGVNATSKLGAMTATDGTTTIQVYGGDSNASAVGQGIDEMVEFMSDLKINAITVPIVVATNNCAHDVEFAGT